MLDRRSFNLGLTSFAFGGLALSGCSYVNRVPHFRSEKIDPVDIYGDLVPDRRGLLDLPPGFRYWPVSSRDDVMDDGERVPDHADGMGTFALDSDHTVLIRNHELSPPQKIRGPLGRMPAPDPANVFDRAADGAPLPGGTTTIIYNHTLGERVAHFAAFPERSATAPAE